MNSYILKYPFLSRVNGEDVMIEELNIPEFITVGMFRSVKSGGTDAVKSSYIVNACSGIKKSDANFLQLPDILGYANQITDMGLVEFNEECNSELSKTIDTIKPVMILVKKITVNIDESVEFACQVLELNGHKKETLNAMDIREFMPAVSKVIEVFTIGRH